MHLFISLTHNCQLRCNYCYAGEKKHRPVTQETIRHAIDFVFQLPMQKLEFGLFGGEPLLEWELFQYATEYVEQRAQETGTKLIKTVTTNGVLLDREKVDWLREHAYFVVVSIDGNAQMHDTHRLYADGSSSFEEVRSAIATLQEVYTDTGYCVISVVTPQNIVHLLDSVKYLYEELHIQNIHLSVDYFAEWGEETEAYTQIYHAIGAYVVEQYRVGREIRIDFIEDKIKAQISEGCAACSFGERKLGIAPSGNIYPCERLIGEDDGTLCIGNVYEGFDTEARAQVIQTRGNTDEECQACPVQSRCVNHCGCTNHYLTGSINTTGGTLCFFQKLMIAVADEVGNRLYAEQNRLFLERFYFL